MNAREHLNFAGYSILLLGAGFQLNQYVSFTEKEIFETLVGVGVGSLLPDIDHKNATLSKIIPLYLLHNVFKKFKIYIFKHGGITHTMLINVWIGLTAYMIESLLIAGIALGYFTHIYIDDATGNKLNMLWWPFVRKRGK